MKCLFPKRTSRFKVFPYVFSALRCITRDEAYSAILFVFIMEIIINAIFYFGCIRYNQAFTICFHFSFLSASRTFGFTTSPLLCPLPPQGVTDINVGHMLVCLFRAFRPSPFGVSSEETKYSTSILCRNSSGVVPPVVTEPIVQVRIPAAVNRTVVQVAGAKNGSHCAVSPKF